MSAGAPLSIWRARVELAANENFTGIEGSLVKASPRSCRTFVREAAPNTVIAGASASAAKPGGPASNTKRTSQAPANFFMMPPPVFTMFHCIQRSRLPATLGKAAVRHAARGIAGLQSGSAMPDHLASADAPMRTVRQLLVRQLAKAIAGLRRRDPSDHAVHEARKELKRARAALRLLRRCLGDGAYRRGEGVTRAGGG